ncbi:MAG: hypothetical protein Ct9H300mP4_00240 [Gammaproteobacteria bacterium]|nr:MAG: hypothetical protein Ct9H300mP4_00240 [Gammaproteobacteria bacterium]
MQACWASTISVPVGFNQKGLPMGMQIIGKKGDDLKVVSFAKKYEEIFTFSQNRPTNFFNLKAPLSNLPKWGGGLFLRVAQSIV